MLVQEKFSLNGREYWVTSKGSTLWELIKNKSVGSTKVSSSLEDCVKSLNSPDPQLDSFVETLIKTCFDNLMYLPTENEERLRFYNLCSPRMNETKLAFDSKHRITHYNNDGDVVEDYINNGRGTEDIIKTLYKITKRERE